MRTYWAKRGTAGGAISSSGRGGIYAAATGLLAGFLLIWSSSAAAADACPNEALRSGPSAALPDCRAYELASPVVKNGLDVITDGSRASSTGAGIVFETQGALPGSPSAGLLTFNLARRDADGGGWTTEPVSAPMNPFILPSLAPMMDWTPDLSRAIVQASSNSPLLPDSQPGAQDLYLRDTATGAFSLVSHSPGFPGFETEPDYRGASEDLSHVVYNSAQNETAGPPPVLEGAKALYEGVNGETRVVGVLPNDDLADSGAVLGSGRIGLGTRNAVSADGSRIVFTTATQVFGAVTPSDQIHVRIDGTETVFVSGSRKAGDDPEAPRRPPSTRARRRDGSAVFFTSPAELTDDATTGGGAGRDLYRFDVDDETLVDLAPSPDDPNGAEVQGVVGTSDDGSHVYFVANAQLDGEKGIPGEPNLYLWQEGVIEFIATLSPLDAEANWNNAPLGEAPPIGSRVSGDGSEALITTVSAQGGFDNAGHGEIYRYSTTPVPSWTCISCNRLGEPATADATLAAPAFPFFGNLNPAYLNRVLSSGQELVFFSSGDQLVEADQNNAIDAYRWHDGELSLISAGEGQFPSFFLDADTSGDNAYIATRDRLVPEDTDNLVDVYDVRVNGGIPAQPAPPGCGAEPCRGPSPGPGPATEPGTANFAGPGNPKPRIKKHCHRKRGKRRLCHRVRHNQADAGRTNRG